MGAVRPEVFTIHAEGWPVYTKRIFTPRDMLHWTRFETLKFVLIALLPVLLVEVLDQHWVHLPWLPVSLVGTAVAFILGFQNNATYDRLWEARKIWGGVVNTSRAWGFMVCDFVTDDFVDSPPAEGEMTAIRSRLIHRHIAWMAAFRYTMRSKRPWEAFHTYKSNREWSIYNACPEHQNPLDVDLQGHLSPEDMQAALSVKSPATELLAQQSHDLRALRRRGLIDDFRHVELQAQLTELVALQGKSERIKNFPYPRQYATLNAFFLWIFLIMLPFASLEQFLTLSEVVSRGAPGLGEHFIWLSVPTSVVVMWVFHTIERIGRVSENPFEGTANDVPISTIARGIEIDLLQMIREDEDTIPAPLPGYRGIQF